MTTIEAAARLEWLRLQRVPAPMFWCLHCHRRTVAEWEPFDPATTFPPVPFCPRCGEHYQCGECGFEIDLLGDCQRFKSTGDDTCSTNTTEGK